MEADRPGCAPNDACGLRGNANRGRRAGAGGDPRRGLVHYTEGLRTRRQLPISTAEDQVGGAATPEMLEEVRPVAPHDLNRIKTLAAMFISLALFAAARAHAASTELPACTITGTNGPDILNGTPGRDVICGLGGNDQIAGNGGNDVLIGGPGDDLIGGGKGNDVIYGGAGNDRLQGDGGSDTIYGGPGNDTIWAWDGAPDRLNGGTGIDRAWKDKYDTAKLIERFG